MKTIILSLLSIFILVGLVQANAVLPTWTYQTNWDPAVVRAVEAINQNQSVLPLQTQYQNYTSMCKDLNKRFRAFKQAYYARGEMYPMESRLQQAKELICQKRSELGNLLNDY